MDTRLRNLQILACRLSANTDQQLTWFVSERSITARNGEIGERFDLQCQYGIVVVAHEGEDGLVRSAEVGYQNPGERTINEDFFLIYLPHPLNGSPLKLLVRM